MRNFNKTFWVLSCIFTKWNRSFHVPYGKIWYEKLISVAKARWILSQDFNINDNYKKKFSFPLSPLYPPVFLSTLIEKINVSCHFAPTCKTQNMGASTFWNKWVEWKKLGRGESREVLMTSKSVQEGFERGKVIEGSDLAIVFTKIYRHF